MHGLDPRTHPALSKKAFAKFDIEPGDDWFHAGSDAPLRPEPLWSSRGRSCGAASSNSLLFRAQIAAWVRLLAPIFLKIAFTWAFTVGSAILKNRATCLLESPRTMRSRMATSRADKSLITRG